jgi:hypothetical protein
MKTISMKRDFTYRATSSVHVQYLGGAIYTRVPEAAVRAIWLLIPEPIVRPVEPTEND